MQINAALNLVQPPEIDAILVQKLNELVEKDINIWTVPKFNRREAVRSFFQYPAMMVPYVPMKIIEVIKSVRPDIENMIDPYMGSGTAIIAGMQNGLDCYGQDINPMALLLSKVKTGPYSFRLFNDRYKILLKNIEKDKSKKITINFTNRKKWFKRTVAVELSKILKAIKKEKSIDVRRFFWVTLAETIRLTSNDRTSTYKLHIRDKEDIEKRKLSPIKTFSKLIDRNIEDLQAFAKKLTEANLLVRNRYPYTVNIELLNTTHEIKTDIQKNGFDLLVTSPPYGDNNTTVPYGQHSFLPLNFISLKDIHNNVNNEVIKTAGTIDRMSLGGCNKNLTKQQEIELLSMSGTLDHIIKALKNKHKNKVNKVINFINDLNLSLDKIVNVMKKDSYMVFVIGNRHVGRMEIKNNIILTELLEHKKIKRIHTIYRSILNKRMASRNNIVATMNKEEIIIYRKVG